MKHVLITYSGQKMPMPTDFTPRLFGLPLEVLQPLEPYFMLCGDSAMRLKGRSNRTLVFTFTTMDQAHPRANSTEDIQMVCAIL